MDSLLHHSGGRDPLARRTHRERRAAHVHRMGDYLRGGLCRDTALVNVLSKLCQHWHSFPPQLALTKTRYCKCQWTIVHYVHLQNQKVGVVLFNENKIVSVYLSK